MDKPTIIELKTEQIRIDGDTQPRTAINTEVVEDYAALMLAGETLPAAEAVFDGKDYWLWDGFHRYHGTKKAGHVTMMVNVVNGTVEDARWLSLGANKKHGLRRTNEDKRHAVEAALKQKPNLSDNVIAEHCGVSQPTVSEHRKRLQEFISQPATRTGRDGRTINTSNIGKKPAEEKVLCQRCQHLGEKKHCPDCKKAQKEAAARKKNGAIIPGTDGDDEEKGDSWEAGPNDEAVPVTNEQLNGEQPAPATEPEPEPAESVRLDTPKQVSLKKAEDALGKLVRALDELKLYARHSKCLQAVKDDLVKASKEE